MNEKSHIVIQDSYIVIDEQFNKGKVNMFVRLTRKFL